MINPSTTKLLRGLLPAAFASMLILPAAFGQYLGSDNFDDNNYSNWGSQYAVGGTNAGTLTNINNRLEFTTAGGSTTTKVIMWNNTANTSYTNDWTSSVTVSNTTTPATSFNLMGLQVFSSVAEYGYVGLYVYRSATQGTKIIFEKGRFDGTTWSAASYGSTQADTLDVELAISFNSTTKDLTLGYSLDGGATFNSDFLVVNPNTAITTTFGADVSAGAWQFAPTNGFSFRILGKSNAEAVGSGVMFADNFSVTAGQTAIPESSTYAALAGACALGLAVWNRKRRVTA